MNIASENQPTIAISNWGTKALFYTSNPWECKHSPYKHQHMTEVYSIVRKYIPHGLAPLSNIPVISYFLYAPADVSVYT
jgi:hypothetical protein